MKPAVSVLMCTYNAEQFIEETIESILEQTEKNIEVLILDNNSTDKTRKIIKTIKDPRIHIFASKKNLGPYGGLNFLLPKAQGKYIAIQDHDDLWHPEKLEKQITFLERKDIYVGCGTKTLMRYEGDQMGFEYFLGRENYYTIHPSLVFRNNPDYRYPDGIYMNDAVFQKKILCKDKKLIYNLNETLTMHRIKDGATNYSYKWYTFTWKNLQTVFGLHPTGYALLATGFELMRKLMYPLLRKVYRGDIIDKIERIPFRLQGYKMGKYTKEKMKEKGFILS